MKAKSLWQITKEAAFEFIDDRVPRMGAALAFYTVLSLGPLLVITVGIIGLVYGPEAASGQLVDQIKDLVGEEGAKAVQTVLAKAHQGGGGMLATIIGFVTLFIGASAVFGEMQDAMNNIWEVQPAAGRGIWGIVRARFLSFTMVLGVGFLLLVSLILSAGLAALSEVTSSVLPQTEWLLQAANTAVSFAVITVLFAAIFRFLPDAIVAWRDVWLGAIVTALLFTVGKLGIGLYLGNSGLDSAYGAAGSFMVLLVWIYYSTQILFFGAELTKAYATRLGSGIQPADGAEPLKVRQLKHVSADSSPVKPDDVFHPVFPETTVQS